MSNTSGTGRGIDRISGHREKARMMDISEQLRTWRAFTGILKWLAFCAGFILLAFFTYSFCIS